ncbi:hypothetical protein ACWCQQ_03120 [Streptomyces sp. NPDC002143]
MLGSVPEDDRDRPPEPVDPPTAHSGFTAAPAASAALDALADRPDACSLPSRPPLPPGTDLLHLDRVPAQAAWLPAGTSIVTTLTPCSVLCASDPGTG